MTTPMAICDDEIFRRKLLMDGEGMGDDKRLNNLLKMFYKWTDSNDDSEEDIELGYERLLATLENCELAMAKSQLAQAINYTEMANYDDLYKQIENSIDKAQNSILERKADLLQSKRVRKNKQQYDALAKIIKTQPDRKLTMAKLQELEKDIQELEKKKLELTNKFDKRCKQFQVLINASYELKKILKSSNEADEMPMDIS